MLGDLGRMLETVLSHLEAERAHIDHQIAALNGALTGWGNSSRPLTRRRRTGTRQEASGTRPRKRYRMSRAARRAVSQRMTAYWAARRTQRAKTKSRRAR